MYLLEYKYVYQVILFKFHCLCLKINKLFYERYLSKII